MNMHRTTTLHTLAVVALCLAGAAACAPGEGTALIFNAYAPANQAGTGGNLNVMTNVQWVRFGIFDPAKQGAEYDPPPCNFNEKNCTEIVLKDMKKSKEPLVYLLEGLDPGGFVVARGAADGVVYDGTREVELNVMFGLIDAFGLVSDPGGGGIHEMPKAVEGMSVVVVPEGRYVLITGGLTENLAFSSDVLIYKTNLGRFRTVPDAGLNPGRAYHTSTRLDPPEGQVGRILIAGGETNRSGGQFAEESIVLFDPVSEKFQTVASFPASEGRSHHTATKLLDGKVLFVGGRMYLADSQPKPGKEKYSPLQTAYLFDPADKSVTQVGALNHPRAEHAAALLPDGRVMIVGGEGQSARMVPFVEIYDPATQAFTVVNDEGPAVKGHGVSALVQYDGSGNPLDAKVLVAGGLADSNRIVGDLVLLDADGGPVPSDCLPAVKLNQARAYASLSVLDVSPELAAGGGLYVLVAGGLGVVGESFRSLDNGELLFLNQKGTAAEGHFCNAGQFTMRNQSQDTPHATEGRLAQARHLHAGITMPNGGVLLVGGLQRGEGAGSPPLASAEVYTPPVFRFSF